MLRIWFITVFIVWPSLAWAIPTAVWQFDWDYQFNFQNTAYLNDGSHGNLSTLALGDAATGNLEQQYHILRMNLGYGITDRWDILLKTSYGVGVQKGSIGGVSQDLIEHFGNRTIGRFGNISVGTAYQFSYNSFQKVIGELWIETPFAFAKGFYNRHSLQIDKPGPAAVLQGTYSYYFTDFQAVLSGHVSYVYGIPFKITPWNSTARVDYTRGYELLVDTSFDMFFGSYIVGIQLGMGWMGASKLDREILNDSGNYYKAGFSFGWDNWQSVLDNESQLPLELRLKFEKPFLSKGMPDSNLLVLLFRLYL